MKTFCPACGKLIGHDAKLDPDTGLMYCLVCVPKIRTIPWPACFCPSCGDYLPATLSEIEIIFGRQYCQECGVEKRFGVVGAPLQTAPQMCRNIREETTPWQEYAIRVMEG